jgi:hypothetical protein
VFKLFRRRNAAARAYPRLAGPPPTTVPGANRPDQPAAGPNQPPAWATGPTVALPRPGRAGWLTPAQTWRANGGRW